MKRMLKVLCVASALGFALAGCGGGGGEDGGAVGSGTLYFSQDNESAGLYVLDTATGLATHVGKTGVDSNTVGLAYDPEADLLYGSKWAGLLHISRDGTGSVQQGTLGSEGLAYDSVNGILYGAINGEFFTIDKTTGDKIADLNAAPFDVEGLAVETSTGRVFGIGDSTLLVVYDPATTLWTEVGDTGLNWNLGGLAYDPYKNVLYVCGQTQGNDLYTLNPGTAAATLVGDSGVTLQGGLAFAPDVVNELDRVLVYSDVMAMDGGTIPLCNDGRTGNGRYDRDPDHDSRRLHHGARPGWVGYRDHRQFGLILSLQHWKPRSSTGSRRMGD